MHRSKERTIEESSPIHARGVLNCVLQKFPCILLSALAMLKARHARGGLLPARSTHVYKKASSIQEGYC